MLATIPFAAPVTGLIHPDSPREVSVGVLSDRQIVVPGDCTQLRATRRGLPADRGHGVMGSCGAPLDHRERLSCTERSWQ